MALRETVRIALKFADLNDLQVRISDIQNTYIQAPLFEKIQTALGPEFWPDSGKPAVVFISLYELNSAGASFQNYLAD